MAANGTFTWRVSSAAWLQGMELAFHRLNPKGTSVADHDRDSDPHPLDPAAVPLGEQVQRPGVHVHVHEVERRPAGFSRDAMVASHIKHVHLMTTYQWVCQNDRCPIVVGHVIVYADWQRLTIAYSTYLSHVFYESLRSIVVPRRAAAPGA